MAFHGHHMGGGGRTSGMPAQQQHHLSQPYADHLGAEGTASAMLRAMAAGGHPDIHHHQRRNHFGQMHDASPSSSSPTADQKGGGGGPTWLSSAMLRQQASYSAAAAAAAAGSEGNFLQLHQTVAAASTDSQAATIAASQWLQQPSMAAHQHRLLRRVTDNGGEPGDSLVVAAAGGHAMTSSGGNQDSDSAGGALGIDGHQQQEGSGGGVPPGLAMGGGGTGMPSSSSSEGMSWENARYKAEILSHPLYDQLLSAHVACLRIATPVDQLPRIDAQLAQSHAVVGKYSVLAGQNILPPGADDAKELDHFMTHYVLLLCSFKEQLQQHVRVHAMEAVMACWELEQSLQSLTGVSPGEGTGAIMSDDEDDQGADSDTNLFDGSGLDGGGDTMGFGPLVPTESERTLMERVRHELKHELKQGYKEKLVDIREEILRKRRAGKLPGDSTSVLKTWWQTHSKWPYPTEDDKARLVQETGLQLKQINNWFINQRKRNWHSNPSSSTAVKSKRKSGEGDKSGDHFM